VSGSRTGTLGVQVAAHGIVGDGIQPLLQVGQRILDEADLQEVAQGMLLVLVRDDSRHGECNQPAAWQHAEVAVVAVDDRQCR
jgi:hypothetical protein